ncbi:LIM domain and actin-binding protein 1 isoform X25 [Harmonia axyridis]|uniref:LIM domain and actin-binding protein 1 isoform X25 n=1 Tax=Harmonia axyridis TaxID=115357 RepID=UPI001E275CE8|nr:LIM domain and actin-binding protein 1 isoform X25 [Harmonia axyridis]
MIPSLKKPVSFSERGFGILDRGELNMAETVKKSRIVSEDNLEESLMEEFNMRLKSCLSQDTLEKQSESTEQEETLYENIETVKSSSTITKSFLKTERTVEILNSSNSSNISNGHSDSATTENIYENVQSITKTSSEYMDMDGNVETIKKVNTEVIYEDLRTEDHGDTGLVKEDIASEKTKPSFTLLTAASVDTPEKADLKSAKDRMLLSTDDTSTLFFTQTVTSPMLTPSEENVDFLKGFRRESSANSSPKDSSRSEESSTAANQPDLVLVGGGDVEVIAGIEKPPAEKTPDGKETSEPLAEKYVDQVQENIYENLETMDESIYENLEDLKSTRPVTGCFDKLENTSESLSEALPEIVSQIEQRKMYEFAEDDDVTETSDVYSLDKQVSDSDSSNFVLDPSRPEDAPISSRKVDRFGVIQDYINSEGAAEEDQEDEERARRTAEDLEEHQKAGYDDAEVMDYIAMTEQPNLKEKESTEVKTKPDENGDGVQVQEDETDDAFREIKSPGQTRIVDEIVKNYIVTKSDASAKNRERDTETVPAKIVQNLTSQFMKGADEKEDSLCKNKKHDVNQLKSVGIMKQINRFEQKDEIVESTQITENYVETTSFDSNMGEKAMKKKKTKKTRKEEKENISVNETNLESFYNVSVKNLRRSFGDLTKIDDKIKKKTYKEEYSLEKKGRSKSLNSLTSCQKYFDKNLSGVSVKTLKEKFNTSSHHGQEKTHDNTRSVRSLLRSSSQNLSQVKSSFSKFDALQKKNVLHIRSSDSTRAQEKFNGTGIDTTLCKCCGKQVFQMEQIKAEKAVWHKNCFRCHECNKQLNVDTYESHEGTLYCKPHFKALFAPKAVDDIDEPPSDKPDLGLEELQSLNVKERFHVFEQHQSSDSTLERTQVNVKRSPSILSKLAKFQSKGMDIGVTDESLNGIPIEESSSDEEEENIPEGEDAELVRAKRVQKEKPFHFTGMSDVKNRFEHGESNSRDERREERKQEIQSIRNKLFMGKQGKMKEAYQEAVMKSESSVNLKKEDIQVCDTKTIKERFEKGEIVQEAKDEKDEEELEIYESEISKKSRSLFLELDANASKAPQLTTAAPKLEIKKAREGSTPERELYHDPDIVRADEVIEDSVIAKETHTATKMLNKFRQMEENMSKEPVPQGPKPLKRFTPPPEPSREDKSSEEEGSESEEEEVDELDQINSQKVEDEDLIEAKKAARAKQLTAKFEKWEAQEIKKEQNNLINVNEDDQSQIESTKLLRERFESMKATHIEVNKQPKIKVNRFV